jgi:Transcriptional repressor TCF25
MTSMLGCPRTALEVTRLLLSLDPLGDPMGALLSMDTHALMCKVNNSNYMQFI